jgi:uncharacterized lipoprotein NlpE involved in copper resistance
MPSNRWSTAIILSALLALAACSRTDTGTGADTGAAPTTAPAAPTGDTPDAGQQTLDLTWQGVLPCADCDGIQTRLRLLSDGQGRRYELQEAFLAGDGGEVFEGQGAWAEESAVLDDQPTVVYRLDKQGVGLWFALQPDGALEMLDGQGRPMADRLSHRLQRM